MFTKQTRLVISGVLLMLAFGFGLGLAVLPSLATNTRVTMQVAQTSNQLVTEVEQIYADVYSRVGPSVVAIDIAQINTRTDDYTPYSEGSGFVIDKEGHIATNAHVVEDGDRIVVNLFDGTITRAEIVGIDRDSDLAVIKVDLPEERLHPVTFANSNDLIIGQQTLALGSPFGERWTLTSGIISALDRRIEGLTGFAIGAVIQTDAAINPGNSGGPLLNLQGHVIGVNSQIVSASRSNSGVGFAVPSNLVMRVVRDLIDNGTVSYSSMGVGVRDLNLDIMEEYDLPNNLRGVLVYYVQPDSPASEAEMQQSDIIIAFQDTPIDNRNQLHAYLAMSTEPGQSINLTVLRNGEELILPLTLGER